MLWIAVNSFASLTQENLLALVMAPVTFFELAGSPTLKAPKLSFGYRRQRPRERHKNSLSEVSDPLKKQTAGRGP
jgi:hypothetical protein